MVFGWFKRASQKTSLLNVKLATKTLVLECNRADKQANGDPNSLPSSVGKSLAKSMQHLIREIETAKNVEVPLETILDTVRAASEEQDVSSMADTAIAHVVLRV